MFSTAKLYVYAAFVAIGLLAYGAVYVKGRIDSAHAAQLADLQQQLAKANDRVAREQKARTDDVKLATENAAKANALEAKIMELTEYVEEHDGQCLSGPDADRLRKLWQ